MIAQKLIPISLFIGVMASAVAMPTAADIAAQRNKIDRALAGAQAPGSVGQINVPKPSYDAKTQSSILNDAFATQGQTKAESRTGSDLMVFVSMSMPPEKLRAYSQQAKDAGAILVLRGFHRGSMKSTSAAARKVNPAMAEWMINPELFKLFKVDTVPAIVLTDARKASAVEDGCAPETSFTKVRGDVSIEQALLTMRQRSQNKVLTTYADTRIKRIHQSGGKR